MALTRPILASVGAFDATQAYTFTFSVIGGDRVVGNTLTISQQNTGNVVYNQAQDVTDYTHVLPAGTLSNGQTYTAYVQTKNEAGELSAASNVIQFTCYASATLVFTNMPPNNIVPSADYEFEVTYSQPQGDSVATYIFNLYDVQGVLVSTSDVQYMAPAAAPPTTLAYKFSGFADNSSYLIECVVNSAAGLRVTTGRVSITVSYDVPVITGGITVVPNCQDGYMQGYIDWRQVPVGIDKLRVKRRRANEFNWITLKEFDNRARTMTMVERPQAGIDKFYAINDDGAAVVKRTGISNRSAATTSDNGDTWDVGSAFSNGNPDQIVGRYVANNYASGYYEDDGVKPLRIGYSLSSNITVKSEGGDQANIPYGAVMGINSISGAVYEDGVVYAYNHFPRLAHPVLYAYSNSGSRRRILCHDYDTKKIYAIKLPDAKNDLDAWTEVETKDADGNAFVASQLTSFDGRVYAMDYTTKAVYLHTDDALWEKLRALPSSIGTVRGFAATERLGFDAPGVVCQLVIADENGLSFVTLTGNMSEIELSTTSFVAGARLSTRPNLSVGTTMRRDSTGHYIRTYFVFDAANGKMTALDSALSGNTWSSNVVTTANAQYITPIMNKMQTRALCAIATSNGSVKVVEWKDGTIADVVTHTGFYAREPFNYTLSTSITPLVCYPASVLNQYRPVLIFADRIVASIYPEEFVDDLYPIIGLTPMFTTQSSSGSVRCMAGPDEDNVIMETMAGYLNIRGDGRDVVRYWPYSYNNVATIGTSAGNDITNAIMAWKSGTNIQFTTYDTVEYEAVEPPTLVNGQFVYNGNTQAVELSGVDRTIVGITGDTSAIQSGRYIIYTRLLDTTQYRWADGSSTPIGYLWDVDRVALAIPSIQTTQYTYTTQPITPVLNYDSNYVVAGGDLQATNAGVYHVTFTIADVANYEWEQSGWFQGGNSLPYTIEWVISSAKVAIPTVTNTTFQYDGTVFEPTIIGLDSNLVTVSGTTSTSEVGNYTITFSLKDKKNYKWSDNTDTDKTVNWSITPAMVTIPSLETSSFVFAINPITPTIVNVDSALVAVSGDTSAVSVGTHTIVCSLRDKANYRWTDGTSGDKTLTWSITKYAVKIPGLYPTTFVYDGTGQIPSYYNIENDFVDAPAISSNIKDVGTYTVSCSLIYPNDTEWTDGTTADKILTWSITKASVEIPSLSPAMFVYSGEVQQPAIENLNATAVSVGGTTSATDADTYTVTFDLTSARNYQWTDGGIEQKTATWQILPSPTITIPKVSVSSASYEYTGEVITPKIVSSQGINIPYDSEHIELTGDLSATVVGDYTITASLKDSKNYRWTDNTSADKTIAWKITARDITVPSLSPWVYPYDGGTVTADIHGISTANLQFVEFSGDLNGVSIGDYTIIAHLVDPVNTRWQSDKTTADKELQWSIATAKTVTLTRQSSVTRNMANMEVGSKTYTTSQTVKVGTGGRVTFTARSERPRSAAPIIRLNGTVVKTSSTQTNVSYSMDIDSNTKVTLITNTIPSYPSQYYGIINITTS
nr:MAG TPA_asm: hypothetical protein [Bacteriophage sp.]